MTAATTVFGRADWIEIERTDGTVVEGLVAYANATTVKVRSAQGLIPRWVNRADIAQVHTHIPNPAR
jgi:hypothetical protein